MILAIRNTTLAIAMLAFVACAMFSTSPEAQIKSSANTLTASAKLATFRLQSKAITPAQARNYADAMRVGEAILKDANVTLLSCRKATNSTEATLPDPCKGNVELDVNLAATILTQVEATLKAKEQR